jgi:hypothetical protein
MGKFVHILTLDRSAELLIYTVQIIKEASAQFDCAELVLLVIDT